MQKADGELIAISSIAIGADTIFAREVLHAGIKWVALLPMPREIFREDFTPENWAEARAESLMAQAVRGQGPSREPSAPRFTSMSARQPSTTPIASSRSGTASPPRGPGGTAEIVTYAKKLGREITLCSARR